jgi:lysyl-tRNA synthetase class 2
MLSRADLELRAQLWNDVLEYIRTFFRSREYTEVQAPIVVKSPGMEPNLSPLATDVHTEGRDAKTTRAGLITSPEYSMKKLLAGGMQRIFTMTPVFRDHEYLYGQHGIEFTMLEWYRQQADYTECMKDTEELVNGLMRWEGEWPRISYVETFTQHFGAHPADITSVQDLGELLQDYHAGVRDADDLDESIDFAFQTLVLPDLCNQHERFFLTEFPVAQASLAQKTADGRAAQRFEAYVRGMELCNGFTELVDPAEQRARFLIEQEQRRKAGKEVFPVDEELLSQLASVASPTYGNALGIDRLVMLKAGASDIDSIHLFPPSQRF